MLNYLKDATNITQTQNGANAYETTKSTLLDFFGTSGALRGNASQYVQNFSKAYATDPLAATKLLFYSRDIRGGQGERENFRQAYKYLIYNAPEIAAKIMPLIPTYGRWDDIFIALDTSLEPLMIDIVCNQIGKDIGNLTQDISKISLLAKWMPSEKGNYKKRHPLISKILKTVGLTPKEYRQDISKLRKAIDIVERKMSGGEWNAIEFNKVPSQALLKYRTAFYNRCDGRFEAWLDDKTSKIQTKTLHPHQIVQKVSQDRYAGNVDKSLNVIWENLPNYVTEGDNTLVVVDTSGSMETSYYSKIRPIDVSVSLGIYFAERNKGRFHNHFITFSEKPKLQEIVGNNIQEKVSNLLSGAWGYNTNLQAVFDLVLNTAIENRLPQSEIPNRIMIVSDMEFDQAVESGTMNHLFNRSDSRSPDKTKALIEQIEQQWVNSGYKMPQIVFWNVNAATSQFPINADSNNKILVSGFDPQIMQTIMKNEEWSPLDMMWEVINSDRYALVDSCISAI